ncbi:MAG: glycosyltransferase family 2 protein [Pseudomonadota bacterium]|nr:glycosyltransferase family 2 protein [Pseudomonadota bacterium]
MTEAAPDRRPLVSVVIPVYNEEENVELAYSAVKELFAQHSDRYRLELFFSDNHSNDGTLAKLTELAARDPDVRVIRLARNFGVQRSILTSYRLCSGDVAIQLDCDLEDPPELMIDFLKLWEQGHDVVVGIRRKRQEPRLMQLMRRMFYRIARNISQGAVLEDAGDFRLIDRSVLERLRSVNDARPYTRGLISELAARQAGVAYDRTTRRLHGKSKFPFFKLLDLATDGLVSNSIIPLRIASLLGVLVFIGAGLLAAVFVIGRLVAGHDWPAGFATLSILLLMSMGLNAMLLGILGEYIGRIYDQVRVRPLSIIEMSLNIDRSEAFPAETPLGRTERSVGEKAT